MKKTVETRICEVTVFNDQALVTRRGVLQLTGEEHELVIDQLPVTLVSESVRVSGSGTVAVGLLGVRTERTYASEEFTKKIAQLHQEIDQIEEQKRYLQDQLTLLNLQRNFVKNLSNQYLERLTKFPDSQQLNLDQIRELLDFVGQQYREFSKAIATSEKEQQKLDKQLQIFRGRLQPLSTPAAQERFQILITLEPSVAGEFELEVSYIVHQVSWVPLYDLHFSTTHETIYLSYLAQVKQTSGEDWQNVTLTLSTAKPGLGTRLPKLTPWYIDVSNPNVWEPRGRAIAQSEEILPRAYSATMPYPGSIPVPETTLSEDLERLKAQIGTPEVLKLGGIVTFKSSTLGNIPSDGATHQATIFQENYPCRVEYIAMPRLVSLPYLQATIMNPLSGVTLLPGQGNIFRDHTFVGTTQLDNIAPGQEFKLNLGIDEGLKIDRVLVERQVEKKLIGNQKRTTYAYRIVITNLREIATDLCLLEQLPVSRNEQIKVRLNRTEPQIQMGDLGILEWSLTLPSQSKQELYYQFTIEHPHDLTIVGLDI
jgi:uncharacterized protein (TIGR02231 family)